LRASARLSPRRRRRRSEDLRASVIMRHSTTGVAAADSREDGIYTVAKAGHSHRRGSPSDAFIGAARLRASRCAEILDGT